MIEREIRKVFSDHPDMTIQMCRIFCGESSRLWNRSVLRDDDAGLQGIESQVNSCLSGRC